MTTLFPHLVPTLVLVLHIVNVWGRIFVKSAYVNDMNTYWQLRFKKSKLHCTQRFINQLSLWLSNMFELDIFTAKKYNDLRRLRWSMLELTGLRWKKGNKATPNKRPEGRKGSRKTSLIISQLSFRAEIHNVSKWVNLRGELKRSLKRCQMTFGEVSYCECSRSLQCFT